jgi:hypothetical protein
MKQAAASGLFHLEDSEPYQLLTTAETPNTWLL